MWDVARLEGNQGLAGIDYRPSEVRGLLGALGQRQEQWQRTCAHSTLDCTRPGDRPRIETAGVIMPWKWQRSRGTCHRCSWCCLEDRVHTLQLLCMNSKSTYRLRQFVEGQVVINLLGDNIASSASLSSSRESPQNPSTATDLDEPGNDRKQSLDHWSGRVRKAPIIDLTYKCSA